MGHPQEDQVRSSARETQRIFEVPGKQDHCRPYQGAAYSETNRRSLQQEKAAKVVQREVYLCIISHLPTHEEDSHQERLENRNEK